MDRQKTTAVISVSKQQQICFDCLPAEYACRKTACADQGMLPNSFTFNVGGFSNNNYWSSSEYNANNAWKQNFNNGNQNNNNKNNNNYVRCVRTFNQNTKTDAPEDKQLSIIFDKQASETHKLPESEGASVLLSELFSAYYECRSNKRNTANALYFELNYESNLVELCNEINNGTYKPGRSIAFIVNKPVKREIFAADFRDRVVHHYIIGKLNPYFEKHFINDSYSCRIGKGTHYGIKRVKRFIRTATNNYKTDAWILKLDIEAFFMNINKGILFENLSLFIEKVYDKPNKQVIIDLCRKIIYSDCRDNCIIKGSRKNWNGLPPTKSLFGKPKEQGIPIGNLTSQVFANFYLSAFDHFVKHELKIKYYGRYVDDIIIVHHDKEYLKSIIPILSNFLLSTLQLTVHPKKIYLQHCSKGVSFLGCYLKPNRIYINKRTKSNFFATISKHNKIIRQNKKISMPLLKNTVSSLNSYLGILKHYNTYKLRKRMLLKYLSGYYFNYLYISGNYGKMVSKIKIVKHKSLIL